MTAKEVNADMTMDTDWSTYIKILYSSETDRTTVTFDTTRKVEICLFLRIIHLKVILLVRIKLEMKQESHSYNKACGRNI